MGRGGWIVRMALAMGAALLPLAAGCATPARGWTLIDIGTLGGPGSHAAAISNSGIVVGCADVAGGGTRAFIYSDGTMRDLGTGGGPADGNGCALAVNNEGVAAGRSTSGELVVWRSGAVTRLGVQGDVGAIDDFGTVVGSFREGTLNRAFKWSAGTLTPLGESNVDSHAARINARGVIAGRSSNRAFLLEGTTFRDLGTLGGTGSNARGLNDRGEAVGHAANENGQPLPFLFDGTMRALDGGPSYSSAVAINNRGQVVGSAEGTFGYLVDGGEYTRLDTLAPVVARGWRRLEPTGINDRGWIVGTARTPEGDMRGFLLIPRGITSSMAMKSR